MACTACFVCLASTVSVRHKKTLEKQALLVGTKIKQAGCQGRQAYKAARQTGLQGC